MSRGDSAQPTRDVQRMKPKPTKKSATRAPVRSADAPVVATSGKPQRADEVESYWTKERMDGRAADGEDASRRLAVTSSPAPSGVAAPGSAPRRPRLRDRPARRPRRPRESQPAQTGVVTSPAATPNPGYWTDDAMADAQPMDKTRPGGSGSQGEPDPGGPRCRARRRPRRLRRLSSVVSRTTPSRTACSTPARRSSVRPAARGRGSSPASSATPGSSPEPS